MDQTRTARARFTDYSSQLLRGDLLFGLRGEPGVDLARARGVRASDPVFFVRLSLDFANSKAFFKDFFQEFISRIFFL